MFFVGATGQILTLILTVCLPFVLLVSGNQKIDVQSPSNYLIVNQEVQRLSFSEKSVFCYATELVVDETSNSIFKFDDFPEINQFPPDNIHVKWKSVYSTSSGNKAPPVIFSFNC